MATQDTFGQAVFKLLVDDKQFQASLTRAVQTAMASSKKIGDLSVVKIAPPNLDAVSTALQDGSARVNDFVETAEQSMREFAEGLEEGAKQGARELQDELGKVRPAFDAHGKDVDGLTERYKHFFREQRFQHRLLREIRGGTIGLLGPLSALAGGMEGNTGVLKRLNQSMLHGIETLDGLEFSLFSVSNLASKSTGVFGTLAARIGALAGPIGIAAGAGVFLLSMLHDTNEEAKKAAEQGLSKLDEMLQRLTRRERVQLLIDIEGLGQTFDKMLADIDEVKGSLLSTSSFLSDVLGEKLLEQTRMAAVIGGTRIIDREAVKDLEEQRDRVEKVHEELTKKLEKEKESEETLRLIIRAASESTNEYVRQEGRLVFITESLKAQKDILTQQRLTEEQIQQLVDEKERIERKRAETQRTSLQKAKDEAALLRQKIELGIATDAQLRTVLERQIEIARAQGDEKAEIEAKLELHKLEVDSLRTKIAVLELQRQLGIVTTEQYVRALEAQKAAATTQLERLQIEAKIRDVLKAETDELLSQIQRFKQIADERQKQATSARIAAIENEFDRERALEEKRFEEETEAIRERLAFVGPLEEEQQRQREQDIITLQNMRLTHERNLAAIEEKRRSAQREAVLAAFGDEQDRAIAAINARYDALEAQATKAFEDEKQRIEILAALRERREQEVQAAINKLQLDGIERIAAAMSQLGDEGVQKFARMLQTAVQIARTLEKASQGLEGGGPLDVLASFVPLFGLFLSSGGELPGGAYVVNVQQARRHKALLDALGAGEVEGGVRGEDSVPFKVRGTKAVAVLTPGERIVAPRYAFIGRAINEGRIIRRAGGGVVSAVREYLRVNPTISANVVSDGVADALRAVALSNAGVMEAVKLVGENITRMKQELEGLADETASVRDAIVQPIRGSLSIDNGKVWFRRELPDALAFEKERSA